MEYQLCGCVNKRTGLINPTIKSKVFIKRYVDFSVITPVLNALNGGVYINKMNVRRDK